MTGKRSRSGFFSRTYLIIYRNLSAYIYTSLEPGPWSHASCDQTRSPDARVFLFSRLARFQRRRRPLCSATHCHSFLQQLPTDARDDQQATLRRLQCSRLRPNITRHHPPWSPQPTSDPAEDNPICSQAAAVSFFSTDPSNEHLDPIHPAQLAFAFVQRVHSYHPHLRGEQKIESYSVPGSWDPSEKSASKKFGRYRP
jgi:hypothetical protein